MTIIKKDGRKEEFKLSKVKKAITSAMKAGSGVYYPKIAAIIADEVETKFAKKEEAKNEDIDKFIIKQLNEYGQQLTAVAYEKYKLTKFYQK